MGISNKFGALICHNKLRHSFFSGSGLRRRIGARAFEGFRTDQKTAETCQLLRNDGQRDFETMTRQFFADKP